MLEINLVGPESRLGKRSTAIWQMKKRLTQTRETDKLRKLAPWHAQQLPLIYCLSDGRGGKGLGHFRSAGISLGLSLALTSSTFVRMSVKCQNKSNADKNFIACQKCLRKKRKSATGGCFSSHILLFAVPLFPLYFPLMLYQMSRLEYFSLLEFACGTSTT